MKWLEEREPLCLGLETPPGLPVQPSYVLPMAQSQGVQQPTPMMVMSGTPGVSQHMVVSGEALERKPEDVWSLGIGLRS